MEHNLMRGIIGVLLAALMLCGATACAEYNDRELIGIEVRNLPQEAIPVGEFDSAGIQFELQYDNGTTERKNVREDTVPEEYRHLLQEPGVHTLEFLYRGFEVSFTIELREYRNYQVRFLNALEQEVSVQTVREGLDAVPPTAEQMEVEGYRWLGTFDKDYTKIQEDKDIKGEYVQDVKAWKVVFYNGKNQIISEQTVRDGGSAVEPSESERAVEGYIWVSWDSSFTDLHRDTRVYGVYAKGYYLNYEARGEGGISSTFVSGIPLTYGTAVMLAAEAKEGNVFVGWYQDEVLVCENAEYTFTMPAQDLTLTAVFEEAGEPATPDEYFIFTLLENGTYSVRAKNRNKMPAKVVLPSSYNGKAVTEIADSYLGNGAFSMSRNITEVVLPDSISRIGNNAFLYCSNLTSITIGNEVKSIGGAAFFGCMNLTSVMIGNAVTSIGASAFCSCTNLTNVTIGRGVMSIGWEAFSGCSNLESIAVSSGNRIYHSAGNCLIETKSKKLVAGCKNSVIPVDGSVTNIENFAFRGCKSLTSIEIPSCVTSIGKEAFFECSGLVNLTIGYGVTSIGEFSFRGCTNLESITVSIDNRVYHSVGNCLIKTETKKLVVGCKNSVIPVDGSVTSIEDFAYEGCSSLTSIEIPISVMKIGAWAFSGCNGLTSVTLGNGIMSIGDYAFSYCSKLENIEIPDSITSIGNSAFYGCSGLTSLWIPAGVTSIGMGAFGGCNSLESITVCNSNRTYHSAGNCLIETATKLLLAGCNNSVIPANGSVTSIGDYAFYGCSSLTSIELPESLTSIREGAFYDCSGLTSISIPASVTVIGDSAFRDFSSLREIVYHGTKAQWEAIDKGVDWASNTNDTFKIICTDGVLDV